MTTDELEDELRSAFTRAATQITVPQQARHRLLQRDYHPRSRSRRHRRLALRAIHVGLRQLGLELLAEQLMAVSRKNTNSLARRTVLITASSAATQQDASRYLPGRSKTITTCYDQVLAHPGTDIRGPAPEWPASPPASRAGQAKPSVRR